MCKKSFHTAHIHTRAPQAQMDLHVDPQGFGFASAEKL